MVSRVQLYNWLLEEVGVYDGAYVDVPGELWRLVARRRAEEEGEEGDGRPLTQSECDFLWKLVANSSLKFVDQSGVRKEPPRTLAEAEGWWITPFSFHASLTLSSFQAWACA
jgi:hypothetical protein